MEWTTTYILSQVFTIIMYMFLGTTYFVKSRKTILFLSFTSLFSEMVAFIFLQAWTGLAMCIVAIIRNIVFLIDEKKNGKNDKITKKDIYILIAIYVITIALTIPSYVGFLSLLSVFATSIYTYSIWQKNVITYKLFGILSSGIWISYHVYTKNISAIILEGSLLVASACGYILALKKIKSNENKK